MRSGVEKGDMAIAPAAGRKVTRCKPFRQRAAGCARRSGSRPASFTIVQQTEPTLRDGTSGVRICLIRRWEGVMTPIAVNFVWRLAAWTVTMYAAAVTAALAFGVEAIQLG